MESRLLSRNFPGTKCQVGGDLEGRILFVDSGCVIQAIDGEAAEENLRLWDEIFKSKKLTP